MPAELATIDVPFRLRDSSGNFVLDTVLANYNILILKAGVTFVVTPTITTPGSSLGRHLLSFLGGTEDDYQFFIDHIAGNVASIEGGVAISDKFLTSQLATGVRQILIEKILRNKLITGPVAGTITVFDDNGTTVLISANLFQDAAGAQAYQGQGADRRERMT